MDSRFLWAWGGLRPGTPDQPTQSHLKAWARKSAFAQGFGHNKNYWVISQLVLAQVSTPAPAPDVGLDKMAGSSLGSSMVQV